jgi:hypothetical protein
MITDWLTHRIAPEEIKTKYLSDKPDTSYWYRLGWTAFLKRIKPGDELWEFCSPPETWHNRRGREGVAMVRRGKVVRSVITRMN